MRKSYIPVFQVGDKVVYQHRNCESYLNTKEIGVVSFSNDNGNSETINIDLDSGGKIHLAHVSNVRRITDKIFKNSTFVNRMLLTN